jgi:hypothetical protein
MKAETERRLSALHTLPGYADLQIRPNRKRGVTLPYEAALKVVHALQLENWDAWRAFTKDPAFPQNLPMNPRAFYEQQTPGFKFSRAQWLGSNYRKAKKIQRPAARYLSFRQARAHVRSLHLANWDAWRKYTQSQYFPSSIPKDPRTYYERLNPGFKFSRHDWIGL